jgi:hypothetical protein
MEIFQSCWGFRRLHLTLEKCKFESGDAHCTVLPENSRRDFIWGQHWIKTWMMGKAPYNRWIQNLVLISPLVRWWWHPLTPWGSWTQQIRHQSQSTPKWAYTQWTPILTSRKARDYLNASFLLIHQFHKLPRYNARQDQHLSLFLESSLVGPWNSVLWSWKWLCLLLSLSSVSTKPHL